MRPNVAGPGLCQFLDDEPALGPRDHRVITQIDRVNAVAVETCRGLSQCGYGDGAVGRSRKIRLPIKFLFRIHEEDEPPTKVLVRTQASSRLDRALGVAAACVPCRQQIGVHIGHDNGPNSDAILRIC